MPVEIASDGEDQVIGGVAARVVLAHLLDLEIADALFGAEHVVAEGMPGEVGLHHAPVRLAGGHILRARDLFQDDVALQREVAAIQARAHHVAEEVNRVGQILAEDARVVDGLLDGGVGVELGAHAVEVERDLLGVAAVRSP